MKIKLNENILRDIIRESLSEIVSMGDYPVGSNTSDAPWNRGYDDREPEYDTYEERLNSFSLLKVLCEDMGSNASVLDYYRESGVIPEVAVVDIEYSFIRVVSGMNDFGNPDYDYEDINIEGVECYFIDKSGKKMTFDQLIRYLSTIRMKGMGNVIEIVKCAKEGFDEMASGGYSLSDWESFFKGIKNKSI